MLLATFCNMANWLVCNLVTNPKDRCSSDEACLLIDCKLIAIFSKGGGVGQWLGRRNFGPRGPWFEPRPVHISLWP